MGVYLHGNGWHGDTSSRANLGISHALSNIFFRKPDFLRGAVQLRPTQGAKMLPDTGEPEPTPPVFQCFSQPKCPETPQALWTRSESRPPPRSPARMPLPERNISAALPTLPAVAQACPRTPAHGSLIASLSRPATLTLRVAQVSGCSAAPSGLRISNTDPVTSITTGCRPRPLGRRISVPRSTASGRGGLGRDRPGKSCHLATLGRLVGQTSGGVAGPFMVR